MQDTSSFTTETESKIAIIGMAGRFPGASSPEAFWRNLAQGVEAISVFTDEELLASGVSREKIDHPDYVKAGAVLEGIDLFDASFFGYTPREAALMDPQHRVFLECAWEALEHAGYNPDTYRGRIGIYAGSSVDSYLIYNICSSPELIDPEQIHATLLANDKDHLATRVAYKCNLKGPCVTLQTTCSTSLVATHMACQSLLNGEADIMLAGGVTIRVPHRVGYLYQQAGILSSDGHCRTFDAAAQGTVIGNGAGVVVLKRLADALADHDCIYAVILGSAINNDGSLKAGYTAPSEEGQAAVIAEALAVSGVEPDTITYIEAHGTGTAIGDPIEIAALTQIYGTGTREPGSCALGAVKTNIGHLDVASGVAGLIKTIFALKQRSIPPTLHFQRPNPHIDFAATPFAVNTQYRDWPAGNTPRRAAVTSLGIGGTNAHVILEEPPTCALTTRSSTSWQLLPLSAKSPGALQRVAARLAEHLEARPELDLADVAYTLQVGRKAFAHRSYVVCRDRLEASEALKSRDPEDLKTGLCKSGTPGIAFLFPGQGTQYVHMARDLYRSFPAFQEQFDLCANHLKQIAGLDLYKILYPANELHADAEQQLKQTAVSQPALFVIEYALAQLLMSWGIRPQSMIGHSIGEYVAACLAGVFSLTDALALVTERGRLMQQMPEGAMLAVACSQHDIQPLLGPDVSIAAVNSPASCVVSGPKDTIMHLKEQLTQAHTDCQLLHTSHAFHSHMMEPARMPFTERVRSTPLNAPRIAYLSNVTGSWITEAEATDPTYWATHLCSPVQFALEIEELARQRIDILLEVGPGRTLSTLARRHPALTEDQIVIASMRHPRDPIADDRFLLQTVGKLWLAGVDINWEKVHAPAQRARVSLPTYSFDRQRYWIEPRRLAEQSVVSAEMEISLSDLAYSHPREQRNVPEPRNHYEAALTEIWRQLLGFETIGLHEDFFELGGDSFIAVTLVNQIQKRFQVPLSLQHLIEAPSIARQAALIQRLREPESHASEAGVSPLVALKPDGTRTPLFFVHPSGGTVLCYLELARCLDPDQPLYGLQASHTGPGPNYEVIEEVAASYLKLIREVQPHGPYRLGGMSYGGTIAFEMARQLDQQGEHTDLLALFDSHPPTSFAGPSPDTSEFLAAFPHILRMYLGDNQPLFTYEDLQQYDRQQQEDFVFEYINKHKLFALDMDLQELRHFFSMWQIHNRSLRVYNPPDRAYPAPITLFLASEEQPSELLRLLRIDLTDQLAIAGWERLSSVPPRVYNMPGSHYTMLTRPHVQLLAQQLNQCLDELEAIGANR